MYFDLEINEDLLTKRMERKVKRAMKPALFAGLRFWKKKFLPKHFTRQAYAIYRGAYIKMKKEGEPMVKTGHLEEIVINQPGKVHGVSTHANITILLGRPEQYTGRLLRKQALKRFLALKKHGVSETFKQSEAAILRKGGYGRKLVEMFRRQMSVIHPGERKAIAERIKKVFLQQLKRHVNTKEKTRLDL